MGSHGSIFVSIDQHAPPAESVVISARTAIRQTWSSTALPAVGLAVCGLGFLGFAVYALVTLGEHPHAPWIDGVPFAVFSFLLATTCFGAAGSIGRLAYRTILDHRTRLAQLRAESLPDRAKRAAQVLQEAITLVEELKSELDARTALLASIKRQAAEATERATDMAKLSHVDEETTRVLNKYFDEALKSRLEVLERDARGREWLIGTVVAVVAGIVAILVAHFALGF
jgi:hypothetical protein